MVDEIMKWFWPAMALTSCKGTVGIALALVCRRLLSPWLSAQARYSLWLPVIACLVLPVGMGIDVYTLRAPSQHHEQPALVPVPRSASDRQAPSSAAATLPSTTAAHHPGDRSVGIYLALIWAAVALILSAMTLRNLIRYHRIRAIAQAPRAATSELFLQCKAELRLSRFVSVLETSHIKSPMLVGWWSPALLLPAGLHARLGDTELRHVFLHELTHVQRCDVLLSWLGTVVQIIHWFNPIVWFGLRAMRADMEQACDAKVLSLLSRHERVEYGNTLINLTDPHAMRMALGYGLRIAASHSQLKERVIMIAKFDPKKLKYSLVAGAVMLVLTSMTITKPRANTLPQAQAVSTTSSSSTPAPSDATTHSAAANPVLAAVTNPAKPDVATERKSAPKPAARNGIPIEMLIAQVAANIHKRINLDPNAHATVMLYGQNIADINYSDLLTILKINGFTAYEMNNYINIVPIYRARELPVPVAAEGAVYPDDQIVSMSVPVKNACATDLVRVIRPLLSEYAFIAAYTDSNYLVLKDTFANLQRVGSVIKEVDAHSKPNAQCTAYSATADSTRNGAH